MAPPTVSTKVFATGRMRNLRWFLQWLLRGFFAIASVRVRATNWLWKSKWALMMIS